MTDMMVLAEADYAALKYELEDHYRGCPLDDTLIKLNSIKTSEMVENKEGDWTGEPNPELRELISRFRGWYCDKAAPHILAEIEVKHD